MGLQQAFILGAVRSPIGRYRGALKDVRPDDLLAQVLVELAARTRVPGAAIDDVIIGCAIADSSPAKSRNPRPPSPMRITAA
jgi:acetyl-CoA acetyltransferase